jgi:hypothetical protein
LTIDGLVSLALVVLLVRELGLPTAAAITVAENLAKNEGRYITPQGLSFALDLTSFRAGLLERLESAVEIAPIPKRGRPPKNKTGRLE